MQKAITPGAVIERRYQIQKRISDNTLNCCYLAEDANQSNRLVVLSFPRIELLILPGFASAFKDACDNLAAARISGVVKVLDTGLYESQPFAVLPNITHDSLKTTFQKQISEKQTVTVESVLDWAAPLAVSLDELHDADYIHSNVRPDSVYVSAQQVLLGDFITEFALQRMGKFKNAISTLDIADHLAPEYLKSFYTPNYDQYLLATLVYESLSGVQPFTNMNSGDDYRMHVATLIADPLTEHRPDLPEVSDVLAKALSRNPSKRFNSCREFISQLQELQSVVVPAITASSSKVVALKPALKQTAEQTEEVPAEPIITSIRKENTGARSKKGLMLLGGLLLASAAVAYTVISQNNADQITSTSSRDSAASSAADIAAVPVTVIETTPASNVKAVDDAATTSSEATASGESDNSTTAKADVEQSASATKVDLADSNELKSLIQKEALLAHQQLTESGEDAALDAEVASNSTTPPESPVKPSVQDLAGLAALVNKAVNAGEQDFLAAQKKAANTQETASTATAINVVAINNEVAIANTEAVNEASTEEQPPTEQTDLAGEDEQSADQQRINQELLRAQALVRSREAEARRAAVAAKAAKEKAEAEAAKNSNDTVRSNTNGQADANQGSATAESDQDSSQVIAVGSQGQAMPIETSVGTSQPNGAPNSGNNSTLQSQLQERQRLQAFKKKEMARIKAVTDDCTVGGKIHREAAAGNLTFVKSCMAVGVDPNVAQSNRWTLLHIAARSGHLNMSKLLIAKGARVNAKAADGQTALDMAIAQKKSKVVDYLKTRGGVTTR